MNRTHNSVYILCCSCIGLNICLSLPFSYFSPLLSPVFCLLIILIRSLKELYKNSQAIEKVARQKGSNIYTISTGIRIHKKISCSLTLGINQLPQAKSLNREYKKEKGPSHRAASIYTIAAVQEKKRGEALSSASICLSSPLPHPLDYIYISFVLHEEFFFVVFPSTDAAWGLLCFGVLVGLLLYRPTRIYTHKRETLSHILLYTLMI